MGLFSREYILTAISPILIHGPEEADKSKRVEMRGQSLKGMIRWATRAVLGPIYDQETVKRIDFLIHGDTSHAALWGLKVEVEKGDTGTFKVPMIIKGKRREVKFNGYKPGSLFKIVIYSEHEEILDFVEPILGAVIRSFGIGQRWRHGFGKFKRVGGKKIATSDLKTIHQNLIPAVEKGLKLLGQKGIKLKNHETKIFNNPTGQPSFPFVYITSPENGDFSRTIKVKEKDFRNTEDMIATIKSMKAEARKFFRDYKKEHKEASRWREEWFFGSSSKNIRCPAIKRINRIPSRIIYRPVGGGKIKLVMLRVPSAGGGEIHFYSELLKHIADKFGIRG